MTDGKNQITSADEMQANFCGAGRGRDKTGAWMGGFLNL